MPHLPLRTDKCIAEAIGVAVKFGLKAFRLGRQHRLSPKDAAHRTRAADRQLKYREARLRDDFGDGAVVCGVDLAQILGIESR